MGQVEVSARRVRRGAGGGPRAGERTGASAPSGTGARGGAERGGRARGPRAEASRVPLPEAAARQLARSDGELVAAQLACEPADRFLHAHLSALRTGAALLEVTGRPVRRPQPRTVWDMVALVEPSLSSWCQFFASGAGLRAAVESGRGDVTADRADRTVSAAEDFGDAVRAVLEPGTARHVALWAS